MADTPGWGAAPRTHWARAVIVAAGVAMIALVWLLTGTAIERDHVRTVRDASIANANLVRVFEEHAVRSLRSADQLLLHVVREYQRLGADFDLEKLFREWQVDREYVVNSVVSNEKGITVLSSTAGAAPVDLSDREHIRVHVESDSGLLYISQPLLGRVNRSWSLVLTRRINGPDGAFRGVAGLAIDPRYFANFYGRVNLGPGGGASLIGGDGVIRARWANGRGEFGANIQGGEVFRRIADAAEGAFFAVAATDGVRRLYNYRKVRDYPLIITVGMTEDALLADHHERRVGFLNNAALTTLVVLLSMCGLLWYMRRASIAAARVQESESRYRKLVEESPDAIFVHRGATIAYVNAAAVRMLGASSAAAIVGRPLLDFIHRDDRAATRQGFGVAAVQGVQAAAVERRHLRLDGSVVETEVSASLITDALGPARQEIVRDISSRKAAQRLAREADAFLDSIVENIPLMLYVKRADSLNFVRFNKAGEAMTGFARDEVLGRDAQQILPPDAALVVTAHDRAVLEGGVLVELPEQRFVARDNTVRYLHTRKLPVFDEHGTVRYLLGISEDVTHRREQENKLRELNESLALHALELLQASKEMEAFAYSVSHDLRAPVRHIDSFVTMLKEQYGAQLDDEAHDYMERIAKAARRMGKLIDELLKFSRTGRMEIVSAEVDLARLVGEIVNEAQAADAARAIEWKLAPLPTVIGDATLLRLVFENLIGNALKYTGTRDIARLDIECQRIESGSAVIVVRDNGVGFDQQHAGNLFGMFKRLHRQDEFEGTGIGLAHVKRVVTRLGGRVWATGELGLGASFHVELPVAGPAPPA